MRSLTVLWFFASFLGVLGLYKKINKSKAWKALHMINKSKAWKALHIILLDLALTGSLLASVRSHK